MQQRVTSGLTPLPPLPPLQITSSSGPSAGSTAPLAHLPLAVRLTRRSLRRPLAQEREKLNWRPPPRSGACGGGSKGIRLEDLSASGRAKWRKWSNQPDSSNNCHPQYKDTFEDSDDSNESFDRPFSGPSSSAVASSTTGNTSQSSK